MRLPLIGDGRAGLAGGLLAANFVRPRQAIKLNFAVTYACQYKCKTCNIWKKKPSGELTTAEILTFIEKNRGFRWVDITGGEIFLRRDIDELLITMVEEWPALAYLHFPTNGYLTDRIVSTAEKLASTGRTKLVVTVSLDGFEELNDEIRGIRGGYQRQVETFNALRRIPGVQTVLGMTLSKHNLGQVRTTFEACQRDCPGLEAEDFHLNVMQLSGHYYANDDQADAQPAEDQVRRDLATYRELRGRPSLSFGGIVESRFLDHLDGFLSTGKTPMRCHSLRSSCFIDPWGHVYPCISYSRRVGSLRDHDMDLEPIWNSSEAMTTQSEIWRYDCPQCWTACEAYQSILGNLLRPDNRRR